MIPVWWSVALTAVGVLGLWLAGRRNAWGWAIGLGAQLLWIAYAIATQQWGFVVSALAYGAVYGRNLRRWLRPTDQRGDLTMPFSWPWATPGDLTRLAANIASQLEDHCITITEENRIMAELTRAALAELGSSIDEVAGELDVIAGKLDVALANDVAVDAETAAQIRTYASRLRGLRPDEVVGPVAGEPAPVEIPAVVPEKAADPAL